MFRFPMAFPAVIAGCLLLAGGLLTGCGRSEATPLAVAAPTSLESDQTELRALKVMAYEPVLGKTGHRGAPFFVKSRVPLLRQFPCSSCHLEPLAVVPAPAEIRTSTMHLDIELHHADAGVMDCATCHNPDAMDLLQSGDQRDIGFNHAYSVCVQCHFEQVEDWAGGAHGKRLGGWVGRRVVLSCTECHDPHAPAIAPRWPVAFPNLPSPSPDTAHLSPTGGTGHE